MPENSVCKFLWRLRMGSFVLLLFVSYFAFSEIEFTPLINFSLPLCYQSLQQINDPEVYQSKKLFLILVPIIFNIALWYRSFETYTLIRIVIIIEFWKVLIAALISFVNLFFLAIGYLPYDYPLESMLIIAYFNLVIYLNRVISKDVEFRDIFYKEDEIKEKKKKHKITISMMMMLYFLLVILFFIEEHYQEKKFSSIQNIERYYLEGYSQDDTLTYQGHLSFSSDGKLFTNAFFEGNNAGNVGVFDAQTGEMVKIIDSKNVRYSIISPSGKSIILVCRKMKDEENEKIEIFEEWNMETGEKERTFYGTAELWSAGAKRFYINRIAFSDDHKYISTEGRGIAIWDYNSGNLIDFYDDDTDQKNLVWLSEKKYIVMGTKDVFAHKKGEIYIGEINDDKIEIKEKGEMTRDFQRKENSLSRRVTIQMKRGAEKNIVAVMISGNTDNGLIWKKGYVDIWNVDDEKKIFSVESNYKIPSIEFSSDGKQILVLEQMQTSKQRITVWNIEEKKKEKCFYLYDKGYVVDMVFLEKERKLIELKNPMTVINSI